MPDKLSAHVAAVPTPPEFPASNASYNKIVGAMHQAALNASTAAAALMAVQHVKDRVKGVNTYSKKCRKYADEVIAVLQGGVVGEGVQAEADGDTAAAAEAYAAANGGQPVPFEGEPVKPKAKAKTPAKPKAAKAAKAKPAKADA